MATLPLKCRHCGQARMHYGACDCPEARLAELDIEEGRLKQQLLDLHERRKAALKEHLVELGVIAR